MRVRNLLIGLILVLFIYPNTSWGQTINPNHRTLLLEQIEILLEQIERLQAEVERKTEKQRTTAGEIYESKFFDVENESIYEVRAGSLERIDKKLPVRSIDEQLFSLFLKVVDQETLNRYIKEWRVFNDASVDLGGYVELKAGTDDWIFGVNREGYRNSQLVNQSYVQLFIHELAHIWLFNEPEQVEDFKQRFWTKADFRHSQAVKEGGRENQFKKLADYYEENKSRFVSDYATYSLDEDMAETFVRFVFEDKPDWVSKADRKVLFFYEDAKWQLIRTEIRSRLQTNGWL